MTNHIDQTNSSNPLRNAQPDHLAWLWLLIGFLLLPFTTIQTVIPLAAWFAPVFLLRFVRSSKRARIALPLIFLAYAVGFLIATRGSVSL